MNLEYSVYMSKQFGPIYVVSDGEAIVRIELFEENWQQLFQKHRMIKSDSPLLHSAVKQLEEYFAGKRKAFDLPIKWKGTAFQEKVWKALCEIPYGETVSYADIAEKIGHPKAVRAIGQANRANNLAIIVPCHRVIGKNQKLVGYAGNRIDVKEKLLELEKENSKSCLIRV
ncbi:methylated-DNA-[protein]-cysteine S-methyltransferase [Anoxybacillus vitaminiphilus]|uniref:Methylated-DNA--protein-cysteine methyltransferase n=1 Tax=Paranoxybacillus vitaminiphilus TaxID=581036 RepID=A0A327YRC8_9BACL|nr:methylated-DNA--[protein]-cysteine S-methyltransferase [Anoxybacillus vitaminiphilus]RAK23102.1 methylated-DNA-[protein]-cysteine S-methyltransferase [Anoxybacillus vitaminiphilus]